MRKSMVIWGVFGLLLAALSAVALGSAFDVAFYPAGEVTVGLFTNTTGAAVTGMHIEFDQQVTITNKIAIGGFLPAVSEESGSVFDLVGGELVASGTVELDWSPSEARPVLIQWVSETGAVGPPYFTTIAVFGRLLGEGIVAVREADQALLVATFAAFFADNEEFFASLSESLGMPLQDSLMPIIMSAPAEAIGNFLSTIVGMLGVSTLDEVLQGDLDFSSLLALLGL